MLQNDKKFQMGDARYAGKSLLKIVVNLLTENLVCLDLFSIDTYPLTGNFFVRFPAGN